MNASNRHLHQSPYTMTRAALYVAVAGCREVPGRCYYERVLEGYHIMKKKSLQRDFRRVFLSSSLSFEYQMPSPMWTFNIHQQRRDRKPRQKLACAVAPVAPGNLIVRSVSFNTTVNLSHTTRAPKTVVVASPIKYENDICHLAVWYKSCSSAHRPNLLPLQTFNWEQHTICHDVSRTTYIFRSRWREVESLVPRRWRVAVIVSHTTVDIAHQFNVSSWAIP